MNGEDKYAINMEKYHFHFKYINIMVQKSNHIQRLTLLDPENNRYHIPLAVEEWTFLYDYFKPTTDTSVNIFFLHQQSYFNLLSKKKKVISIWRCLKSAITCMSHYLQINKC